MENWQYHGNHHFISQVNLKTVLVKQDSISADVIIFQTPVKHRGCELSYFQCVHVASVLIELVNTDPW